MSELPVFQTRRLTLRPRTAADTDDCQAMDRDPEVRRFVTVPWDDPPRHRRFIEDRTNGPYPPGLGYWTILADGVFAGWILLIPLDTIGPEIEIGWRLLRAVWGRGFATEAARPVLRHGLRTLGLPLVMAEIDPANSASQRVAEKIGMRRIGLVDAADRQAIRYEIC